MHTSGCKPVPVLSAAWSGSNLDSDPMCLLAARCVFGELKQ